MLGAAAIAVYEQVVRPWHVRWGATDHEVETDLLGDDLVAEPARQCTRAITIAAPPERVWPWLVQIGADRGGFYSYDWLENLFGLGIHSADRIVPEWQQLDKGDLVFANASGRGFWYVMEVEPCEALVLQVADPAEGRPVRRTEAPWWEFSWTFALRDAPDATTRLLVRERVAFGSTPVRLAMAPFGPVSFLMTRRMMLGIKARAEAAPAPA
jgi:uncharacterized protein YndB with AHSA1/START domain